MQGTADFHHDITNALLPQAALTTRQRLTLLLGPVIPEPISSDPWQSMENQPFPTLSYAFRIEAFACVICKKIPCEID